jgi:2-keto-4-pentenoate hydratase/2-oxohepta-3-ene-1,7-dioic acid hydratase in catechol pathway
LSPNAHNYDYEAELVIVMGKGGMDIPKEKAAEYIFGYTCGNDVSARDAQNKSAQWLIGKSFPGFAPAGPWVVTADELDPCNLAISCRRGGEVVQDSNTSHMIFDVYTIVSYASRYIGLEPGDLIFTGTPNGVIVGMEPGRQNWLKAGDEITVSIEKIGDLTTRFV